MPCPEYLKFTTRQTLVDDFVGETNCESASLYISKFPYVAPAGITERDAKRAVEDKKQSELGKFCKIASGKICSIPHLPDIPGSISFTAVNKGRLLVDHTGGIAENSNLSLHRFFNCPTIPGSALKGIARNAARSDEDQVRFARVFGGGEKGKSDCAGSVSFLMALPGNTQWKLVVDVLTSHGEGNANPIPVFFPAVETGAVFRFVVAPTPRSKDGDVEFAAKYLKIALNEHGIGAKTAAGYGWFEICNDNEETGSAEVDSWEILGLEQHLQDVLNSGSIDKQKRYLERMIKEKKSLIRKWKNKGNPNFAQISKLAEICKMELPE